MEVEILRNWAGVCITHVVESGLWDTGEHYDTGPVGAGGEAMGGLGRWAWG